MRNLYVGGGRRAKRSGILWKLSLFFFFVLIAAGAALKVSAPFIAEKWLNKHGNGRLGYAYSVRDVELQLKESMIILRDVKVFHPKTNAELVKSPSLKLKMKIQDLLDSSDRRLDIEGERLDVYISSDLNSEIARISNIEEIKKWYFSSIGAKFNQVNFIEQMPDESRTLVRMNDVNLGFKDISVLSVNSKSEFTLLSKLASGGEVNLVGTMENENDKNFWKIEGTIKDFSPALFNRLAGSELPFTFNEPTLDAQITAHSKDGAIQGEITPEITRLNLIDEKPGFPRQIIARALNEELTFSLPFTLKDKLTVEYANTFKKLKEYRKYPLTSVVSSGAKKSENMN